MQGKISLKHIVDRIIKETSPLATNRRSTLINNISIDTYIETDETKLSEVLVKLLANTIKSSHCSIIYISAEKEEGKTFITVSDNNSDYSGYISGKMTKLESLVQNMGVAMFILNSITGIA